MARIRYAHNSFSIGVLSKKIQGNTDFEGYNNALDESVNFLVESTGGLFKRGGTRFVAELKGNEFGKTGNAKLILFSYSADDQYVCEFGTGYIRFFTKYGPLTNGGRIYELETTLTYEDDILNMKVFQDGNILYILTKNGLYSLTRISTIAFKFEGPLKYSSEPVTFPNHYPIGLIPDATTGQITIRIRNPEDEAEAPDIKYAPVFKNSDVGHFIALNYTELDEDISLYVKTTYYLKINALEVDPDFNNFYLVHAEISAKRSYLKRDSLPSTDLVTDWQVTAFSNDRGYPQAAAMFEGRLFLSSTIEYPTAIWGSSKMYNDWTDFRLGTNPADGVQFKIAGQHADEIVWLAAQSKLFVGTRWGIYIAGAATYNDEAISPSNFRVRLFEALGVSDLPPICALDAIFFVDASQKNVHEIILSPETGTYQAQDLSLLANDLTQSGIVAHTWQQTPIKTYWCATGAGHLCALTYLKNNEILAWTKHVIAGNNVSVLDLCTMHGDNSDRVYMIVKRDVGGVFKKYVEYLNAPHDPLTQEQFKQFYVDSGVSKCIKYTIKSIDKGSNAKLILNYTSNVLEEIYNRSNKAFVVFRWNKDGVHAPDVPFSQLKGFHIRNKTNISGYNVFDIFDDLTNDEDPDIFCKKIDPDEFKENIPSQFYDIFVYVSTITDFDTGRQTKLYCDTHLLSNRDKVLFFGTDLSYNDVGYDYNEHGDIFDIVVQADGVVLMKNGSRVHSDNTEFIQKGGVLFVKVGQCTALNKPQYSTVTLKKPISDEDKENLVHGVYINKVPGMIQINSRRYDFKKLLADNKLALYDPDASPNPRKYFVDLDASHYSPYDSNYGGGNLYIYFSKMEGLEHLAGQNVAVCCDGNSRGECVVDDDGCIDLGDIPAMYCSAGLKYFAYFKTVPFAGGSLLGSSVGCVGSQKSMYLHLYYSLGGKYGSEDTKVKDIQYPGAPYKFETIKALYTGLVKCPMINARNIYERTIYVEHSEPLAFNVLAVIQDAEVSDA